MDSKQNCSQIDRRRFIRRTDDRTREEAINHRARNLQSLLELGQIIGLDLQLTEMLIQIAMKACEVMGADRCSLFLHDPNTDELWSTVALGMGEQMIRIPSNIGVAGVSFQAGEMINLEDAYTDPRFNKEVDAHTGYRTKSLLCMPLYNKASQRLGVIQLLNKKEGSFSKEDEALLKIFGNHASVFIEMAQLQKAKLDALEQSKKELERLNRAKSKALDHLSHELRTPLAVIKGNIWILKRKLQEQLPQTEGEKSFETLEKHLSRLLDIQQETDKIIRSYQELEGSLLQNELQRFLKKWEESAEIPSEVKTHWDVLKEWMGKNLPGGSAKIEPISIFPLTEQILVKVKKQASHREIHFYLEGERNHHLLMNSKILEDILESLLKNAVENTPDEGMVQIFWEKKGQRLLLMVQDFGTGITEENQRYIFDGLFHTQETELYASKKPYDFNAGGKGLDLLRLKVDGRRFGFDLSLESQRCIYRPTDSDLCPGRISECPYCQRMEDCLNSGGSTFCVSFQAVGGNHS